MILFPYTGTRRKLVWLGFVVLVLLCFLRMAVLREQPTSWTCRIDTFEDSDSDSVNRISIHDSIQYIKYTIQNMRIDPLTCKDRYGNSFLMTAVRANRDDIVEFLVEDLNWKRKCHKNWSEVHEAAYLGNKKLLKYFLQNNFSWCNHSLIRAAAMGGQVDIIRYLIKHGHPIECGPPTQWSPLHEACNYGQLNVVHFFSEIKGKDICTYCPNKMGDTLLHPAVSRRAKVSEQLSIMKYLIKDLNCNPGQVNNKGQTPFDIALDSNNEPIIAYLKSISYDSSYNSL